MKAMAKITLFFVALALLFSVPTRAEKPGAVANVFNEISEHVLAADWAKFAEHLDSNVELQLPDLEKNCPAAEAIALVKAFFEQHNPTAHSNIHVGSRGSKHYCIGHLTTSSGKRFRTTIFLHAHKSGYAVQQLRIEEKN
ncbi:MAG: DUF4783 domain-containing protein [Prevotellaceae bacterium]|jgi:hypothetical protein|nr:DUF4783 domain-containing protein [Prevotellaceae bacterium]